MRRAPLLAPGLLLVPVVLLMTVGCYPSNVLDDRDRAVAIDRAELPWGPTDPATFPGAYTSVEITGDAAASLVEVRYVFQEGGIYTGAGLVLGEGSLHYQTLDGTWRLAGGRLVLDDDEPGVEVAAAEDHLRLATAGGTVILRRFALE